MVFVMFNKQEDVNFTRIAAVFNVCEKGYFYIQNNPSHSMLEGTVSFKLL